MTEPATAEALRAVEDHNPGCLCCGVEHPTSMGFRITTYVPGRLEAVTCFTELHDGARGRTHGGALATVLDEALGRLACLDSGGDCLTASLELTFCAPALSGHEYGVTAVVERREGRKIWLTGEIRSTETVATGRALFIEARRQHSA